MPTSNVEGYTRMVNGKPVQVRGYDQQRVNDGARQIPGRAPLAAQAGQFPAGRAVPTTPRIRAAYQKMTQAESNKKFVEAMPRPPKGPDGEPEPEEENGLRLTDPKARKKAAKKRAKAKEKEAGVDKNAEQVRALEAAIADLEAALITGLR